MHNNRVLSVGLLGFKNDKLFTSRKLIVFDKLKLQQSLEMMEKVVNTLGENNKE